MLFWFSCHLRIKIRDFVFKTHLVSGYCVESGKEILCIFMLYYSVHQLLKIENPYIAP